MPSLHFTYNQKSEFERIKYTLEKLDWYVAEGYKPALPKGIKSDSSQKEIKAAIKKEFKKGTYLKKEDEIQNKFKKIEKPLSEALKKISPKPSKKIYIQLTRYGVGGSYNPPDKIILNYKKIDPIKTIAHELVHITIQHFIVRYKIEHWRKERVVDLILNSKLFDFFDYGTWQRDYRGAEKIVDKEFKKSFFKNQDDFFARIGRV